MTIQQIQVAINSKANDPRQLINMIADYLQDNQSGGEGSSYLVYTALLNQSGTNAPSASQVYQNDFIGLTWGRIQPGAYYSEAVGQFTINKTVSPPFGDNNGSGTAYLPLLNSGGVLVGYYTVYTSNDGDSINLFVVDTSGNAAELSTLIGNSCTLFIEIIVYQ